LRGEIEQVPPMYSAKKIQGKKLYELARQGIEVERQPVRVTIHEIEALDTDEQLLKPYDDGSCELRLHVVCSAGTYVRVLAEDLGARLGVGAHRGALRRTRAGEFQTKGAVTIENLHEAAEAGTAQKLILPPEAALANLPAEHLTEGQSRRARHGATVQVADSFADGALIRLHDAAGKLIAIGVYNDATQQARPRVMLAVDDDES